MGFKPGSSMFKLRRLPLSARVLVDRRWGAWQAGRTEAGTGPGWQPWAWGKREDCRLLRR